MRKRVVLASPFVAGALYFFSNLYPWFRGCVVKGFPEAAADMDAPFGVASPLVVGPRKPLARVAWCLGLSLDRLNPFTGDRAIDPPVLLPSDRLLPPFDVKVDPFTGNSDAAPETNRGI